MVRFTNLTSKLTYKNNVLWFKELQNDSITQRNEIYFGKTHVILKNV